MQLTSGIQSAGSDITTPPAADELEISVFGPGFGECIVAHLGESQWIVVDSCISKDTRFPVALDYFLNLGVDPAKCVQAVVATHWHDDHLGGLAALFAKCPKAKLVCSMALCCDEWAKLVEIYRGYIQAGGSGIDEMREIMHQLNMRAGRGEIVSPDFAIARRPIIDRRSGLRSSVVALAPSNAAVALTQTRIQQRLMPKSRTRRLRVPVMEENDSSVVLSVTVGHASVLLGADLEERGRAGLGWQVILDEYPDDGTRFDGFKVAHHGSANGFHREQWPKLMHKGAWAALTPYNRGVGLPTPTDCQRILAESPQAYITAPPKLSKFRHSNAAVQKTALEATISIGEECGKQGHIRLRRKANDANSGWRIDLFGDAVPLCDLIRH